MGQRAGIILDIRPGHKPIRWLCPGAERDTEYALQDGVIFGWSESNCQYESAWWLEANGCKASSPDPNRQHLIDVAHARHPFNPIWLVD